MIVRGRQANASVVADAFAWREQRAAGAVPSCAVARDLPCALAPHPLELRLQVDPAPPCRASADVGDRPGARVRAPRAAGASRASAERRHPAAALSAPPRGGALCLSRLEVLRRP